MSYHELSQATATECSQLAFDYDPDCYCAFHFVHADCPPRAKYCHFPAKHLQVYVWRATPAGEYDRYVWSASADTGPELLRRLRDALAAMRAGTTPDPSKLAPGHDCAALSTAIRHPLLPHGLLLHALDGLAERLPAHEARAITHQLRLGITERQAEAYQSGPGGGWIPTAPQTTQPLPAGWPH